MALTELLRGPRVGKGGASGLGTHTHTPQTVHTHTHTCTSTHSHGPCGPVLTLPQLAAARPDAAAAAAAPPVRRDMGPADRCAPQHYAQAHKRRAGRLHSHGPTADASRPPVVLYRIRPRFALQLSPSRTRAAGACCLPLTDGMVLDVL